MADVASSFKNWSTSAASNSPTSSTTIGSGLAPNLQQIQATLRTEIASRSSSVTAASTTDIGAKDEGTVLVSHASGTVAITSFGTVSAGIKKLVTFSVTSGTLTITYNASSMILPSLANITVANGDSLLAESLGSGNWKIHLYSDLVTTTTATSDSTFTASDGNPVSSDWVKGYSVKGSNIRVADTQASATSVSTTTSSLTAPAAGKLMIIGVGSSLGTTPSTFALTASLGSITSGTARVVANQFGSLLGFINMSAGQSTTLTATYSSSDSQPKYVQILAIFIPGL